MSGKKIFSIIVSVGVVVALLIFALKQNPTTASKGNMQTSGTNSNTVTAPVDTTGQSQVTGGTQSSPQPQGTTQPSQPQPQKSFPKDYSLSSPNQIFSAGSSGESLRIFNVHLDASGYHPSEITVNQGDTLQINLQASSVPVDVNSYELRLYAWAPPGKIQPASVTLSQSGVYQLSCKNNCAGATNPTLTLAVLPK